MARRIAPLLVLVCILTLAFASVAYAAATSGYATWSSSAGDNGSYLPATPHNNYYVGTVKCAVCHAVHKGSGAAGAQVLLRSSMGGACTYCHIENNLSLPQIYDGDVNNYDVASAQAHNNISSSATEVGSRCTDCHSVHGSGTMSDAAVSQYILRDRAFYNSGAASSPPQPLAVTDYGSVSTKNAQVTVFCTNCHPYYQPSHSGTITVAGHDASGGTQNGTFQSHIMANATANYAQSGASYTGRVAWVGSNYCRSCHDGGIDDAYPGPSGVITNSFPHYTPDYTRFLISRDSSSGADANTAYAPSGTTSNNMPDGVCIKCHVEGSAGVGQTF